MKEEIEADYIKAERAYMRGQYAEAVAIIDLLAEKFPDCPSVHLFRGYIYGYGLEEYEIATQEYELVLTLAPHDQDFVNNALRGTVYNETLLKVRQNQTRR